MSADRLLACTLAAVAMLASSCINLFQRSIELPMSQTQVTPGGVLYEDLRVGSGPGAADGQFVSVHYTGMLLDGSVFDASRDRGLPVRFRIGAGTVIPGWEEGMIGMRVGGQRRMAIPPGSAYGGAGRGELIPPHATLHLEVELLELTDDPPP